MIEIIALKITFDKKNSIKFKTKFIKKKNSCVFIYNNASLHLIFNKIYNFKILKGIINN